MQGPGSKSREDRNILHWWSWMSIFQTDSALFGFPKSLHSEHRVTILQTCRGDLKDSTMYIYISKDPICPIC